jgi:ATP-dependent helicase/nuclease subunit B
VQILTPIEARLLNFDLIILTSLNEGNFPKIESENWLGKKIRKDLGVDKFLEKTGQNAYDFCNYLSNKKIVLTRSKSGISGIGVESIFLTKFKAICEKLMVKINDGAEFLEKIKKENAVAKINSDFAQPRPALDLRPNKFAITEISKLMQNPYFIYCKKILRLKPLNEIDYKASYAEFGSFVHKALEEYLKNSQIDFKQIFDEFFIEQEAKIIWWPKFQKFFANFLNRNQKFLQFDNLLEVKCEAKINNILLHGRIDRVALSENSAIIFDYKTGAIPSKKQVQAGLDAQLTLAALILIENELQNCEISALKYWKLSNENEESAEIIAKNNEEVELLIESARVGLQKLFDYFSKQENAYVARNNLDYDDFKHLARFDD